MPNRSPSKKSPKRSTRSNGQPRERKLIRLPYVKKLARSGPVMAWQVDGSYIRTNRDEEFTNYGHHYTYQYIPKDEFWIDQGISPEETKLFITRMKYEYRQLKEGKSYDEVRKKADALEEKLRKQAGDLRKLTKAGKLLPEPTKLHRRLWKRLDSGVSVWIVNARLVRSVYDDEFASGGHDYVYEYIPENEIWIDDTLKAAERPFSLLHELHERNIMSKGKNYDDAHAESSKLEKQMRRRPDLLHDKLADEGWE